MIGDGLMDWIFTICPHKKKKKTN